MDDRELLSALRRLKVETGSLACMGCGHEHNCGIHGCAILNQAIERIEGKPEVEHMYCVFCGGHGTMVGSRTRTNGHFHGRCTQCGARVME
jgi:hypothetical protein